MAAFAQGHRDGVADAERDISATLVQYEEWYFRNGYERAMAELENWQPTTCESRCGHRVCVSLIPALIHSAAAISCQEDCTCTTCNIVRRLKEAEKSLAPPEPIDRWPTPAEWPQRYQGSESN